MCVWGSAGTVKVRMSPSRSVIAGWSAMWGEWVRKRCGAAGQDGGLEVEVQVVVGVEEGFEEPVAEEAGAAGDEEASVAEVLEGGAGVLEDLGEVGGGEWAGGHVFSMPVAHVRPIVVGPATRKADAKVAKYRKGARRKLWRCIWCGGGGTGRMRRSWGGARLIRSGNDLRQHPGP